MINVAVLGFGVVGSGVVELIEQNKIGINTRSGKLVQVVKILDIRDFTDSPFKQLLTKESEDIFTDASISVVIETIGGATIAYELTKKALRSGKHVVTSNKELVATHGPELLALAAQNNVHYLFEASVGGGIPIIRPLYNCLAANEITGITGILNGTTNYILTAMKKDKKHFPQALREAQTNGYAEADPTADIEGHDACRKIAILSSIAYNQFVDYKDICTEGISKVTLEDIQYAEALGCSIKLIGESRKINDKVYVRVSPVILDKSHMLSNVEDVFNAIVVEGNAVGDTMFYGKGAGKFPTASAVVADVMEIAKKCTCNSNPLIWDKDRKLQIIDCTQMPSKFLVRIKSDLEDATLRKFISDKIGAVQWIERLNDTEMNEFVFITTPEVEAKIIKLLDELESNHLRIMSRIRVLQ